VAVLALAFALVHGDVRPPHELLGVFLAALAGAGRRDPDAGGHDRLVAVDLEGEGQVPFDPLRDLGGLADVFEVFEQHAKLVPGDARERVAGAQPGRNALGHRDQEPVARVVAQGVVEALELVQVHVQHRDPGRLSPLCPALGTGEGVDQTIRKERPVGQSGEGVVEGPVGELVLESLALGEVLEHEPHLQEGAGLVADGVDECLEPARPGLGLPRLDRQGGSANRAVGPALLEVRDEPRGAEPLVLEGVGTFRGSTRTQGPQRVPGGVHQQVPAIGAEDGGGQRGLLYGNPQVQIGRGASLLCSHTPFFSGRRKEGCQTPAPCHHCRRYGPKGVAEAANFANPFSPTSENPLSTKFGE
jgi:hypothetical protein